MLEYLIKRLNQTLESAGFCLCKYRITHSKSALKRMYEYENVAYDFKVLLSLYDRENGYGTYSYTFVDYKCIYGECEIQRYTIG